MDTVRVTIHDETQKVSVPGWVTDLNAFRRWFDEVELPEHARVWWLAGEVWVDMSRQQIFSHVLVKTKFTIVLGSLADNEKLGLYLTDGVLLSNFAADFAGVPDGLFVSTATLQSDRVRLIEGKDNGFVELQGTPDMVLEVVSRSSLHKDTVLLKKGYWEANIREYWLVDAREDPLRFDIFRHTSRGYTATRRQNGWLRSTVFRKAFRLTQRSSPSGHPDYLLETR